jgi:hypothetical protein
MAMKFGKLLTPVALVIGREEFFIDKNGNNFSIVKRYLIVLGLSIKIFSTVYIGR